MFRYALCSSLLLIFAQGCAITGFATSRTGAGLVTVLTEPLAVAGPGEAVLEGDACAVNIFGLVVAGNTSMEKAKLEAGIRRVSTVDVKYRNILGLVGWTCTVVRGDARGPASAARLPARLGSVEPMGRLAPGASMPARGPRGWYVQRGADVFGPLTTEAVKRHFKADKINWDTRIKRAGWPTFKELRAVKEFYGMN